jgi:hypothetical protein
MNTDHTGPSGPQDDPANRWATEHYGFEEDSVEPASSSAPPSSEPRTGGRRHAQALVAAGVLGLLMAGGIGSVALAAEGGGDGPQNTVFFDGGSVDGDGPGDGHDDRHGGDFR